MKHLLLLFTLLILANSFYCQDKESYYTIARNKSKSDSIRLDAYKNIVSLHLQKSEVDSLKPIYYEAAIIAKASNKNNHLGLVYNFLGLYYFASSNLNYDSAKVCYIKALNYIDNSPPSRLHAILNNNLSIIYQNTSQLDSLKHHAEQGYYYANEIDDYQLKSMNLQRLSDYYRITGNYSKALDCDNQAISLARNQGDTTRIIMSLFQVATTNIESKNYKEGVIILKSLLTDFDSTHLVPFNGIINANIGMALIEESKYKEGLKYTFNSIRNSKTKGLNYCLAINNIAESYMRLKEQGLPDEEIPRLTDIKNEDASFNKPKTIDQLIFDYYNESLQGIKLMNNENYQVYPQIGLGEYYYKNGKIARSITHYNAAYEIAINNDLLPEQNEVSLELYKLYKLKKDDKNALKWHELHIAAKDSLNSKENQQAIGKQLAQFEFSNVRLKDSLEQVKKDEIKQIQIEQQNQNIKNEKLKKYYLYGGLGIALFLLLFLFRRFNITKKQKQLIELQKAAMEEKQIELSKTHLAIKDSINYSKKIQKAIFPSKTEIDAIFPNNFVLFKPKDIVSGDFYWSYTDGNKKVIVVGDCTGHGVPGAFMTIIGINILKEILHDGIYESAEILKTVNHKLKNRLNQNNDSINDGMDLGVCVIDNNMIEYSGAHFPLYHITDNQLIEYKGSNIFLGNDKQTKDIKTHYIPYKKDDSIYLVTDGFPDQRGGIKGKKYFYKPLRNLLLKNSTLPLSEQKNELELEFNNWLKNGDKEQMDDVSVIGIKF